MNTTEKNIKELLIEHNQLKTLENNLEDNIMHKINRRSDYKTILVKTKRNAKIGIIISVLLLAIYTAVTYTELLNSYTHNQSSLDVFIPSIFTIIVVIVMYVQMTLGTAILRKRSV